MMQYLLPNPPVDMIAYHLLENNALDSAGSYNGTGYGTSYDGQSVNLTGASNSYITLGAGKTAFKVSTYSVSIWLKADTLPNAINMLVDNHYRGAGGGNTYNSGCRVGISNTGKLYGQYIVLNNESTTDSNGNTQSSYGPSCYSNTVIPTGTWAHVAYTVNGNEAALYVNGILESTVSSVQSIRYANLDDNYALGILKYDSIVYYPFDGRLSHHRAYDRVLTSEEILNIYNYEKELFAA